MLKDIIEQHKQNNSSVTLAVHQRDEVSSLGVVKLEGENKVIDLVEKFDSIHLRANV